VSPFSCVALVRYAIISSMSNTKPSVNPKPTAIDVLRSRYHAYLASERPPASVPDELATDDARGRVQRAGAVAGKETRRGMRQGAEWSKVTSAGWQAFTNAWQLTPEDIFFFSDLHLGHHNIITYCDRPFSGVFHQDASLLANANATVRDDQWLLFVGDLAMWKDRAHIEKWMAGCPGRKALVLGNHDLRGREHPVRAEEWMALGFEAVADVAVLPAVRDLPELWITHYPLQRTDIPSGKINVHGHIHVNIIKGPYINACVEQLGYQPRNLDCLVRKFIAAPPSPNSGHKND
jgi:calcineurin-like phosphoesterase family protein